ncbi:MAG: hypothetical protein ACLVD8_26085 [Enterocloster sp.]|uniref:hypothetical protein n=1 Tax=Enterocloster sp. TaxID=2719315 RepID=UPI00399B7AA7
MELQQLILMEKEIMNLDGVEILPPVGPENRRPAGSYDASTAPWSRNAGSPDLEENRVSSIAWPYCCSKSLYAAINCHHLDQPHLHPNQPEPRPKPCDTAVLAGRMDVG